MILIIQTFFCPHKPLRFYYFLRPHLFHLPSGDNPPFPLSCPIKMLSCFSFALDIFPAPVLRSSVLPPSLSPDTHSVVVFSLFVWRMHCDVFSLLRCWPRHFFGVLRPPVFPLQRSRLFCPPSAPVEGFLRCNFPPGVQQSPTPSCPRQGVWPFPLFTTFPFRRH